MSNLCARGLLLKVQAPAQVDIRLRNDYARVDNEALTWHLPDLAIASEAWALLELTVPPTDVAEANPALLPVTVSVQAAAIDSAPLFLMAWLPRLPVFDRAQWETMPADALVAARALELDAADALAEVRGAIEAGDWKRAQQLVDAASARFAQHPWAAAVLATMRRLVSEHDQRLGGKEASFAIRRMNRRLAARDEPAFSFEEPNVPAFLRRNGEQGKSRRDK